MAPKKNKGQKMGIGDFLQDTSMGPVSWADEMEDAPLPSPSGGSRYGGGDRVYGSGASFGSNRNEDRGYSMREQIPLPDKPPYTVHLGNLSFDATEGDVHDFFNGCDVDNVRIVEDRLESKPKGFGYVEFKTRTGIEKALKLNESQFQGRNIRVSVAEPQKERQGTRDISDWSRKGPLPDLPRQDQRRVSDRGGFGSGAPRGQGFDNMAEAGGERGGRRGYEPSDGKIRDFGNWDRKGPLTPTLPAQPPARSFDRPGSRDGPALRRNSPAWGEGRSQDSGSRPPRREFVERPPIERAPTAAEQDSQWRARMKPDVPAAPPTPNAQAARSPVLSNRELSTPPSPAGAPAMPATRPKLNLTKRTVSEAPSDTAATPAADSKASPFGAAKPIDTATREKEVEAKRQAALREKKEAEEKAREDKRIAEEKGREERRQAKEAELAAKAAKAEQEPKSPEQVNGETKPLPRREKSENKRDKPEKENGISAPAPGKQYEILRRHANAETSAADEEAAETEDVEESGLNVGDKETKPQEVVRDPKQEGYTNGDTATEAKAEPTADELEGAGWNVVSKGGKKGRNGNTSTRALAS
ncbi:MAG: hypothetical protein Q9217_004882 [Psora testacea]